MGNVYRLLVDEKARAEREAPMLLAVAEMARRAGGRASAGAGRGRDGGPRLRAKSATRVLDLACGTGIHARLLGRAGYAVTALDSSAAMLAEAGRFANPPTVAFGLADLLQPLVGDRRPVGSRRLARGPRLMEVRRPVARPAALALLLGNTLSVFTSEDDLRAVLANVAAALVPGEPNGNTAENKRSEADVSAGGGLLLVQTLNYARLRRAGGSAVVRCGRLRGRETVVTKSLQPLDDGRHVLLTLTAAQEPLKRRAGESAGWIAAAESTTLRALAPEEIVAAARAAGFRLREAWGGPGREAFDEEKSTDFVGLFELGRAREITRTQRT
jgi:SAM-dependent methyltransferase